MSVTLANAGSNVDGPSRFARGPVSAPPPASAAGESLRPQSLAILSHGSTWAASFGIWTVFGLVTALGSRAYASAAGVLLPSLAVALTWDFSDAYVWALLTPLLYLLTQRHGFERGWPKALRVHIPSGIVVAGIAAFSTASLNYLAPWCRTGFGRSLTTDVIALFFSNLTRYCLIVAVSEAIVYANKYRERTLRFAELKLQLASAQLQVLKMQLEPHFLFNVLNSIAALTREDAAAAEQMTLQLSDLLRISLQNMEWHEVPLRSELEFLRCYLRIQQTRFSDRLTTHFHIAPDVLDAAVPHMVLQPLVENAIRHGISPRSAPGWVHLRAEKISDRLLIEILDNGVGLTQPPSAGNTRGQGVGLKNTQLRLQQLYGDHYEFSCANSETGGCRVCISVPFRETATETGCRP